MKRRQFIKIATLSSLFSGAMVPSLAKAAAMGAADKLVDVKNAMVGALQYVHDASTAKIRGEDKATQYCSGCALYTGIEGSDQGPCVLFAGSAPKQEVKAKGWCVSWGKKS
jgi:hypothetical protein